jgi:hypothetical protein
MEKYERRHSGEFSGLLHLGIEAESIEEFDGRFTEFILSLAEKQNAQSHSSEELKSIIRNHAANAAKRYDSDGLRNGSYIHYFRLFRENNETDKKVIDAVNKAAYEITLMLDSEDIDEETKYNEIVRIWSDINNQTGDFENDKDMKILLWKLLGPVLKGVLEVNKEKIGENDIFYASFAKEEDFLERIKDKNRNSAVRRFNKETGNTFNRTPRVSTMIKRTSLLSEDEKEKILKSLKSKDTSLGGEKISSYLARDAEILAFAENDHIDEYFETLSRFLEYLQKEIFTQPDESAEKSTTTYINKYIDFLKNTYLAALREYCEEMRRIKEKCPYIADLILEPYLLRIRLVDGVHEPTALHLFNDWRKMLLEIQENAGYGGDTNFSFVETHQKIKQGNGTSQKERPDKTMLFIKTPATPSITPKIDETTLGMPVLETVQDTNETVNETVLGMPAVDTNSDQTNGYKEKNDDTWSKIWETVNGDSNIDPLGETAHAMPAAPDQIESRLDTILAEAANNTLTRGNKISSYLKELNDTEKEAAVMILTRKMRDEFNLIAEKIKDKQIDLLANEGHDLYQIILMTVYSMYACVDEMKKHFCFECARFYKELRKNQTLNDQETKNLYLITGTLFGIVQQNNYMDESAFQMLQKDGVICEEEKIKTGKLPDYRKVEFPDINDYETAKASLTDEEIESIENIMKEISKEDEAIRSLESLYYLEADLKTSDSPNQTFAVIMGQKKGKINKLKKRVSEIHKNSRGGWFKRTLFMNKELKEQIDEYFENMLECIENSWKENIMPAYILFGNISLGGK